MKRPFTLRVYFPVTIAAALLMFTIGALPGVLLENSSTDPVTSRQAIAESRCASVVTRTLATGDRRICDPTAVTLTVRTNCVALPLHVVFIESEISLYPAPFPKFVQAALKGLDMGHNPHVKAAVVTFDADSAKLRVRLTTDEGKVQSALNVSPHGGNNGAFARAFSNAVSALNAGRKEEPRIQVVVYIGGFPYAIPDLAEVQNEWIKGTALAKSTGATLVVACPWVQSCKGGIGGFYWERYASPGYFVDYSEDRKLQKFLNDFVDESLSQSSGMTVEEEIPPNLAYIPDSAQPPPSQVDAAGGRLRWDFVAPISRTITLTYRVQPLALAVNEFTGGRVIITDTQKPAVSRTLPLPGGVISVTNLCPTATETPTTVPTLTYTPTPTYTPIAPDTPTATVTATLIPTNTASPTRALQPAYLPVMLREKCTPEQRRVDAVLVLDASQSMLESAAPGSPQTKLDAARTAARAFLDALRLDLGDQAAVVAFNSQAILLTGLTGNRPALDAALSAIAASPQTCLVCGVDAGAMELASPRRKADHAPVLILLTDGRSSPQPASAAVTRAAEAKGAGVRIYTIGLGTDLDEAALREMASVVGSYFHAPSGEELARIYREIAVDIPCPEGAFWGGR